MKHLLEIAKELYKEQPVLKISGSVALNLHGIKTRREPEDLDIYLPKGAFVPDLPGMEYIDDSTSYAECNFRRLSFMYKGIRIDFLLLKITKIIPLNTLRLIMILSFMKQKCLFQEFQLFRL